MTNALFWSVLKDINNVRIDWEEGDGVMYFTRAFIPVEKPMTANAQVRKRATRRCVRKAAIASGLSFGFVGRAAQRGERGSEGESLLFEEWSEERRMYSQFMGKPEPSTELEKEEKRERTV